MLPERRYHTGTVELNYGHSLGAEVAIMAAATRPDLVRAVVHGDVTFSRDDRPVPADEDNLQYRLHMAQNELWHRLAEVRFIVSSPRVRDVPKAGIDHEENRWTR